MTRIATVAERPYRSELRVQQAEETRARILDAATRVMARGIAELTVPAIAREAGVSVPTIYRHFATKRDLIAAVYPHNLKRARLERPALPRTLDDLRVGLRAYFEHVESFDDVARAARASPAAEAARRLNMPERLAMFRGLADTIVPKPSSLDRERIARLLVVLSASSAVRMWREHFGASVDEAADDIDWLIQAAVAAATSGKG